MDASTVRTPQQATVMRTMAKTTTRDDVDRRGAEKMLHRKAPMLLGDAAPRSPAIQRSVVRRALGFFQNTKPPDDENTERMTQSRCRAAAHGFEEQAKAGRTAQGGCVFKKKKRAGAESSRRPHATV